MNNDRHTRRRVTALASSCAIVMALFSGCRSDDTTEPEKPVTLDIQHTVLTLSPIDTIASTAMTLSCGCGFLLDSIHYAGDTSVIHFTSRDTLALSRHTQTVSAWYDPASTPSGPHSAELAFIVYHTFRGVSYTYIDTIRASTP
jgi:hypothetical protein